jgi:multicomponent Na+:H+ antiporter subunit G
MSLADGFTALFVSAGVIFFLAGLFGLVRFPDTLSRLHALSKADNLGLGLVVIGLLPQASWPFGVLKLIALWVLSVLVGGATGQMLAGAIHRDRVKTEGRSAPGSLDGEPSVDGSNPRARADA